MDLLTLEEALSGCTIESIRLEFPQDIKHLHKECYGHEGPKWFAPFFQDKEANWVGLTNEGEILKVSYQDSIKEEWEIYTRPGTSKWRWVVQGPRGGIYKTKCHYKDEEDCIVREPRIPGGSHVPNKFTVLYKLEDTEITTHED